MDFNQVRYFLVLSETLNFTRAAERCHVTQPTLTHAIKRLEDELGGQLVVRDGRHTRLSPLGRALRTHFEQIEQTRAMLKETAGAVTSGEQIEMNIGLMCTIGPQILGRFLKAFQRGNPQAMLFLHDVTPEAIPELLLSGALDGAFCARHSKRHKKLDYVTLFKEALVVAFPDGHEFGCLDGVSLARVTELPYLDRLHCEFRDKLISMLAERGLTLDVAFSSQREDWIQGMIRDGVGVSVIPEYSLIAPQLPHRPLVDPVLERNVDFATVHGGPGSAGLQAMVEMIREFPWAELVTRHRKH
jgi:DNA-binding transcriptional LysR family regulator